jgi:P-type Mg2+ transporter
MNETLWIRTPEQLFADLSSSPTGLSGPEAGLRVPRFRSRRLGEKGKSSLASLLMAQFLSPITLLLIFAAGLSLALGDVVEGSLILGIIAVSAALQFWQERRAGITVARLAGMLKIRATVLRDGSAREIPTDEVVPGDLVLLEAGSAVPGDCLILASKDLYVDESPLTGESFPAEKRPGAVPVDSELKARTNVLYLGTHAVSGTATALVACIGADTLFGKLSGKLAQRAPETAYELGFKRFGYLLLEMALAMALVIFAVNVALHRPVLESLLFTLALTVGLTPQLLPAIQGITMSRGAARMAAMQVIVRRLASIEDIGGMDILCTDKTGTLTEGVTRLESALDARGGESPLLRLYAYVNACLHTGYSNPIDDALRQIAPVDPGEFTKLDEVPYDFTRKRMSVLAEIKGRRILITKGAADEILAICESADAGDERAGQSVPLDALRAGIENRLEASSRDGMRSLGLAYRELPEGEAAGVLAEKGMVFLGMLSFSDPLKAGARESLAGLRALGIRVKLVTGDNRHVAAKIAREAGFGGDGVLSGSDMRGLSTQALAAAVERFDIFAEMDPIQKESVISALKRGGHSVGFLGDGINDASALHAADVGISVDSAVDVTKQAADIVLLKKELGVLAEGVKEGRRAFANTLKYLFITTSANFGNMFSMAGASLFAAFLPMLPGQILLLNVLSDLPAMAIASDLTDPEMIEKPRRWNLKEIQRFMIVFGLVSSTFDFLTFGSLLRLHVSSGRFRTAWFLESVLSELLILLVIRTRRWAFSSRIGRSLLWATALVSVLALALPYLPLAAWLGFEPLPPRLLLLIGAILAGYCLVSELAKMPFYRKDKACRTAAA